MEKFLKEKYQEIDYEKYDEKFDNVPKEVGPEFTELDLKREEYIKNNALSFKQDVQVPEIKGLSFTDGKPIPRTFRWFKRITSYEQNGVFKLWTHRLNTKLRYLMFFPFILWGVTTHVFTGYYYEKYDHSCAPDLVIYDKLAPRPIPKSRIWARPG